jgi:small subunit ribosomal protein S8e
MSFFGVKRIYKVNIPKVYPLNIPSLFGVLMAVWQGNSKRSLTGRRIRYARNKRRFEIGRELHLNTIGTMKRKSIRTRGKNKKSRVLTADTAYVIDPKTNKTTKTEIVTVLENTANVHYVRRNIMNKGAIINTKIGKARITSRPGQSGVINAILLAK